MLSDTYIYPVEVTRYLTESRLHLRTQVHHHITPPTIVRLALSHMPTGTEAHRRRVKCRSDTVTGSKARNREYLSDRGVLPGLKSINGRPKPWND